VWLAYLFWQWARVVPAISRWALRLVIWGLSDIGIARKDVTAIDLFPRNLCSKSITLCLHGSIVSRLTASNENKKRDYVMKKLLPLMIAAAVTSPFAMAHQAGDILVRGGLAVVSPQDSGNSFEINDNAQLGLTLTYMATDNFGVELLAATPFSHSVKIGDTEVAKVKHLPPTLMAQYYFGDAQSKVRPYVGIGVNYTNFFDEKGRGPLTNSDVSLDDSWGVAGQVGIDMAITDRWFVNGSAWIMDIDTDVHVNGADGIKTKIDPMVFMVGAGYRF
jgi:outer membrane protein